MPITDDVPSIAFLFLTIFAVGMARFALGALASLRKKRGVRVAAVQPQRARRAARVAAAAE